MYYGYTVWSYVSDVAYCCICTYAYTRLWLCAVEAVVVRAGDSEVDGVAAGDQGGPNGEGGGGRGGEAERRRLDGQVGRGVVGGLQYRGPGTRGL